MSRKRMPPRLPEADAEPDRSRSQKKRESTALQQLGEKLSQLPLVEARRLDLPDDLLEALTDYHAMGSREAKRRQLQYVGRVMREIDWRPIADRLENLTAPGRAEAMRFHHLETLREALITAAPEDMPALLPGHADSLPEVRRLAAAAREERAKGAPPRASRALFRLLRELDSRAAPEADDFPA